LEQAIVGMATLVTGDFTTNSYTLPYTDSNDDQDFRCLVLDITATLSGAGEVIVPAIQKPYIVMNNSVGGYAVTVKVTGQTGISVPNGAKVLLYNNGTDVGTAVTYLTSLTLGSALGVASGGTGLTSGTSGGIPYFSSTSAMTSSGVLSANQFVFGGGAGSSPTSSATVSFAASFTGANTFYNATGQTFAQASTNDGIIVQGRAGGSSSYRVTFTTATLSSSTTLTLPNVTDTVATIGTAQTFTAAQTFRAADAIRSEAASTQDAIVIAGRAGGTNSYAITLTPATLAASRTLTLPEPAENVTLGYLNTPVNSQSAAYTLVLADAGKTILHPSSDANARTFTIPANGSVAYATGTVITFINMTSQVVTIAITTDTMYLAGTGTTGSRSLAQYGMATAVKIDSTNWVISGTGLT
jgi:hypothetical protein